MGVYKYAEPVTEKGLVIMDTPGFDPVSATGQIAGGANLVCFTTGRSSCFGSYPSPTIKLASNTPMYERMIGDMAINCGPVIDGEKSLDEDHLRRHPGGRLRPHVEERGARRWRGRVRALAYRCGVIGREGAPGPDRREYRCQPSSSLA
jgi:hypothetical protein